MNANEKEGVLEPIAVIGMACRFPGASSTNAYWQNLVQGKESITFFSNEQLVEAGINESLLDDPNYIPARGIIDNVDRFDATLFGYSGRETRIIDPQHRLFLECAWEALEIAGYDPDQYPGSIGVYAGAGSSDYLIKNILSDPNAVQSLSGFEVFIGNDKDFLPTRTSYKLNLTGPSVNVNTACSSSLVAAHFACQSLQNYDCDIVLAGGATIHLPVTTGYHYSEGMILSPDGHCRPFDDESNGTVSGSGVGVVVLKRLKDALEDGDHIYAVISGSAINNDGRQKIGFTAPSVDGQAKVLSEAYELSGVDPATIGYLEAHGTGTNLGDPVEVGALTQAFRRHTDACQFCPIGSVKANVGHLDTAAGIAGFIKVVLSLYNKTIPPSINFSRPNRNIDFTQTPFYITTQAKVWERGKEPRRAGVSSFGIGGTNAHIVLEEAPPAKASDISTSPVLMGWSGADAMACDALRGRLLSHLDANSDLNIADMAYTLALGRHALEHRAAVVCDGVKSALEGLSPGGTETRISATARSEPAVIFMFPGQGSQYPGMGRDLYQHNQIFAGYFDQCIDLLENQHELNIQEVTFAEVPEGRADPLIHHTCYTQPALFSIEYALAKTLMEFNVQPAALIGHSLGEYVAACIAGVMSLEDALKVVVKRSELLGGLPQGEMLSVAVDESVALSWVSDDLSIAAVNSPINTVMAGPLSEINALAKTLVEKDIAFTRLNTSHAFHSRMVDGILAEFERFVAQIPLHKPTTPLLSNVLGTWCDTSITTPKYWSTHARHTVRFRDAIMTARESDRDYIYVEVGPGRAANTIARQCKVDSTALITTLAKTARDRDEPASVLTAIAHLWTHGIDIDWRKFYQNESRRRIPLPTYPFQRDRYWIEPQISNKEKPRIIGETHDKSIAKQPLDRWFYKTSWKRSASTDSKTGSCEQYLVLAEDDTLLHLIDKQLSQQGKSASCFHYGTVYSECGGDFAFDPSDKSGFERLFGKLNGRNQFPEAILFCWPDRTLNNYDSATCALKRLIHLVQALERWRHKSVVRLSVVTSKAFRVLGNDVVVPQSAIALGVISVAPKELPFVACTLIDARLSDIDDKERSFVVDSVITEAGRTENDPIVVLRGIDRWVRDFEPISLPAVPKSFEQSAFVKKVFLITGGFGGIGRTLGLTLAESDGIGLVLIGRRKVAEREHWNEWLATHHPEDRISRLIRAVRAMEEKGAEVTILTADVADYEDMQRVRDTVIQRYGRIDGILHAAGVPAGGVISMKTDNEIDRVLRPKLTGTSILAKVFQEDSLEFVVLFSSITSITGWFGQVDYAAANVYLDACVDAKVFPNSRNCIAINWDTWGQVGMAVNGMSKQGSKVLSATQTVKHPLLQLQRNPSTTQSIFGLNLSPVTHWVLSEHKIMGIPTVPGTFHLELVRAAYCLLQGQSCVLIKEITFMQPLMVGDHDQKSLEIDMDHSQEDTSFVVRSEGGRTESGDTLWQTHAVGKVAKLSDRVVEVLNIDAILARCNRKIEQPTGISAERGNIDMVSVSERWHSITSIQTGSDEAIAQLRLPDIYHRDFEQMDIHTAMLDVATGFAAGIHEGKYLPVGYRNLYIFSPMQSEGWCHVKQRTATSDICVYEIAITDSDGQVLMKTDECMMKRVSQRGEQRLRGMEPTTSRRGDAPAADEYSIQPAEGAEVLRRLLLRDVPNQVVVSLVDLKKRIQQTNLMESQSLNLAQRDDSGRISQRSVPGKEQPDSPPATNTEGRLLEIWRDFLCTDAISVDDDFFELGGDSLLATQIFARIKTELEVDLALSDFFEKPTIRDLGELIELMKWSKFNAETAAIEGDERETGEI